MAVLLGLAFFISYIDRGNLATAAPVIKTELHLSVTQIGNLLAAFYWVYAPMQLAAGWLAERANAARVMAVGFAIWAVATILTGLASGYAALLALRFLLGLGESVCFPCTGKLLALYTPVDQRGRANGAITVGLALGPAFGIFVGGMIVAQFGWRPLFLSLGALSLLWLWPWLTGPAREIATYHGSADVAGPSFLEIMLRREALGASLAHFCFNYSMYFLGGWLPSYLIRDREFSIERMAVLGGCVYLMQGAAAFAAGRGLDRWLRRGATPNRAYKTTLIVGQLGTALCFLGVARGAPLTSTVCLLLAGAACGLGSPALYAAAQTLAGPTAAGRWLGLQNAIANVAGIFGATITAFLVNRTGNFYAAFLFTVAVALIGLLAWTIIVPRIEPLRWSTQLVASGEAAPAVA